MLLKPLAWGLLWRVLDVGRACSLSRGERRASEYAIFVEDMKRSLSLEDGIYGIIENLLLALE